MKNIKPATLIIALAMTPVSGGVIANPNASAKAPPFSGIFPAVTGIGTLTIVGDNGYSQREQLQAGVRASIDGYDKNGRILPNGNYRYEYRAVEDPSTGNSGDGLGNSMLGQSQRNSRHSKVMSGSFTVTDGQVQFQ